MNALQQFLQSASNEAAGAVSGPVDLIGMGLRKLGVPVPKNALMSSEWMRQNGLMQDVPQSGASLAGQTFGLLSPVVAAAKAPQIAGGLLKAGENLAAPTSLGSQRGVVNFDPRFDPRVKEARRLAALSPEVQARQMQPAPSLSLADFEGTPFITSMSDRTAAGGLLTGINDVKLSRPVDLRGGQDFMFDNPGQVWASAPTPVKSILGLADELKRETGKNPLFLPWRMAPSGGDFAQMTGEAMLSYAKESMNKKTAASLDKTIKAYIPDWKGIASDESVQQFRKAPDSVRKKLKKAMDVNFRERGGLSLGEARLAVADPKQLAGADGGVMNVGRIFADKPMVAQSGHPAYPRGVPGEGLGRIDNDLNIFELLPQAARARGIPDVKQPRTTDLRALQMKPYAGILDSNLLKALGY